MAEDPTQNLTALTVELLSAYVSNNTLASEDISGLIASTHAALVKLDAPVEEPAPAPEYAPAVSIRKSIASRDHIISLIDGKPYKTLKRHLAKHGLTIAQYRDRYNLPANYPTVAPEYSEHRRAVATKLGLGRRTPSPAKTDAAAPVKAKKADIGKTAPPKTVEAAPTSGQTTPDQKPARKAVARKSSSPTPKTAPSSAPAADQPIKATAAPRGKLKLALNGVGGQSAAKPIAGKRSTRGKTAS